jgi:predicted RNA-binding Zn ribbon-like protein
MQISNTLVSSQETRHWCLDFVNTSLWHASSHPQETLHSFTDLVNWVKKEGAISEGKAQEFLHKAGNSPEEANLTIQRAIALREIIYRILVAVINHKNLPKADLAEFNRTLAEMTRGASIVAATDGFTWKWNINEEAFDSLVWPVVLSAAELLVSEDRRRLGQCADDHGCGWIFLDQSKNHSRRWCDIRDCGNRAKQRRHNQRTRKRSKPDPKIE